MTRIERKLLGPAISAVTGSNTSAWRELKRQIFDYGFAEHYPAEGDFISAAQNVVRKLSDQTKGQLIREWRNAKPPRTGLPDDQIIAVLPTMIIEEVVARANRAAYRTRNWER